MNRNKSKTTAPPNAELRDLHKVLEVSRAMVAAADLDSLLKLVIDRSMELVDAERATLFLYEPETNELVSRIAAGVDEIRVSADKGIAGSTVRGGKTIIVPDAYADERFNKAVDKQTGFRTRNILSIPLHDYEGGLVGVLQVVNKRKGDFTDHDITLAETLGAQAGVALQRAVLIQHFAEKKQMEHALAIAREIQQGLLPHSQPDVQGFDIAGLTDPADETGGDAYDFLATPDGRLMLLVADASGHGIGPALVVAEARAMLRAMGVHNIDMRSIMNTVNDLLVADLGSSRFVTCFFGMLEPAAAMLRYSSAGHGPLVFYSRQRDEFTQVGATDLPLGVMEGMEFSEPVAHEFQSGDFAIIVTDGVFEASAPDGKMFGMDRVLELIRSDRDRPAAEMITNLHRAVLEFSDAVRNDDITLIAIKKRP